MLRPLTFVALPVLAVLCTAGVAAAQQSPTSTYEGGAPAHVSLVEGSVTLEREGRIDDAPANMPLVAGDRLRTRSGRAEVLFADGSTLHLDHDTTLDLQSDELVRLIGGRLRLSIPGPSREIAYRIDTAAGWAQIADAGEYRAVLNRDEFELAVLRGRAELVNDGGRTGLRAGERAFARVNAAPSYAYVFNSAAFDAFDRWSEDRRSERLGLSTQYLPEEVRPYSASFDQNGSWRYESSYGYVWYPRVAVGWRPYYYGRWVTVAPYGLTWVASDPWGYPTHHYGRWGFNAGVWFWIPGRTWGPAYVSWAYAPGYVSWCPLGWNNRAVIGFGVNVHHGYTPWHAWTVVPHHGFAGRYVHKTVVPGYRIDQRTRLAFTEGVRPPVTTGRAVPRSAAPVAPIRVAGTNLSRSSAAPVLTNRGAAAPVGSRSAASAPTRNLPGDMAVRRTVPPTAATRTDPEVIRGRTVPTAPMVRSERGLASSDAPSENRRSAVSRSYPGTTPSAPPARPAYEATRPDPSRANDLPTYRRDDGYRARPETYAPSSPPSYGRAVPRGEYGRPPETPRPEPQRPSYGRSPAYTAPPSYGAPPRSAEPPSRAVPRPEGSRPGGDAPSRGAARPRGGRGGA